ncbi:MAG: hypothetical protein KJ556_21545, partial [Gammaproteobacteria bacterium]|nr:hypothetical protein [Gammaproteobacteria bacterium]
VNCFCIPGNHGRIGKKGEHGPTDNYDYLTYHLMKERLRQYPNVNFCIPKSMFMLVEVQGRIFYMTHGGEVRSWMGIPYYGLDRARSRIVEMMAEHEVYPDYFITAHVHQQTTIKERHFTNGDWAGGNDFSVGKLNQASRPMQFLFSVHKDYGVTWRTPILLENPTIKKNIKIFKGGQNGKSNRASK